MLTPDEADDLRVLADRLEDEGLQGCQLFRRLIDDAEAVADFMLWFEVGNEIHIEPTRDRLIRVELYQRLWERPDQRHGRVVDRFQFFLSWGHMPDFHRLVVQVMLRVTEGFDVNQYRARLPRHRRPIAPSHIPLRSRAEEQLARELLARSIEADSPYLSNDMILWNHATQQPDVLRRTPRPPPTGNTPPVD